MSTACTVGDYLLLRLKELGIKHIFGVPGDFNLLFLDQIDAANDLEWVGNCNELNAAYAADGYARINGIAALVTTFGVGELSAVNGIAGSYAEQVPVIQITGAPPSALMEQGKCIHHTLGDGDFTHFTKMYKEVTAAQTSLTQENAAAEIDRVLAACWLHKRPVYIQLPTDLCYKEIQAPDAPLELSEFTSDGARLSEFLDLAKEVIKKAMQPVILADYEVNRYQLNDQLLAFAHKTGFPVASLNMGKGVMDENHPQFIGIYAGELSAPYVKSRVEDADCIISLGVKWTDLATGGFTHHIDPDLVIELHPSYARFQNTHYESVAMRDVLEQLTDQITPQVKESLNVQSFYDRESPHRQHFVPLPSAPVTQIRFWERFSQFLTKEDIVVADIGTSYFGAMTVMLPEKTVYVGQPLWASIGYTLPAMLGTQLAAPARRNILLIGDGAFQLTVQELSTILAHELKPVIILINNGGYTVERLIHGPDKAYNDISSWNYSQLLNAFGSHKKSVAVRVTDEKQLDEALKEAQTPDKLVFIEVMMDRSDAPELLYKIGSILSAPK